MQYAIIANPTSGNLSPAKKLSVLKPAASVLNADIFGLNCPSAETFRTLAVEMAQKFDVLVVAGGDGTFSEIVNALEPYDHTLAFLPLGSGNALRHALLYRGGLTAIAQQIKSHPIRVFDLIDCDRRRRAYMASVGFDAAVLQRLDHKPYGPRKAYARAMLQTLFGRYYSFAATVGVDDKQLRIHNLLDVMIVKQPFYGYGLRMVPGARWDDGLLHMRFVSARVFSALGTLVTAAMVGNRVGPYLRGRHITVQLSRPCGLQTDGDVAWESDRFHFRVLPKALKVKG